MSEYEQLTQTAIDICNENYKHNCGGCPIRTECVANTGPGAEAYQRWVRSVNDKADSVRRAVNG